MSATGVHIMHMDVMRHSGMQSCLSDQSNCLCIFFDFTLKKAEQANMSACQIAKQVSKGMLLLSWDL